MELTELQTLADTLSTGFEALLAEIQTQRTIEQALRKQIADVADEYEALIGLAFNQQNSQYRNVLQNLRDDPTKSIEPVKTTPLKGHVSTNPEIEAAWQACKSFRSRAQAKEQPVVRKCPVNHGVRDPEDFERDFTTKGVPGSLECPFAKMKNQGIPGTPNNTFDPITVEFHPDKISVTSQPAAGKCPIRFLDQHSPEEVAMYFENHKHEIPRSHEICVKKFAVNESSIRQLDEKYGNLVNMIQGLGVKHKQYLPEKDGAIGESDGRDPSSTRAVEKWAEDISHEGAAVEIPGEVYEGEEERTGRFEKPLREIRVGESPSRPWGIQVPLDNEIANSAIESEELVKRSSSAANESQIPSPAAGCPFGQDNAKEPIFLSTNDAHVDEAEDGEKNPGRAQEQSKQAAGNSIVFNGPVVLGYSPEQAMVFLQAWKGR